MNKATVFLSLAAFGYTGAAKVAGRIDRWMTEVLSPHAGLTEGLNALKDAATTAFHSSPLSGVGLTMVSAGWDPKPDGAFIPFYATVSNSTINELPRVREKRATAGATAISIMRPGPMRAAFDWYAVAMQPWLSCLVHVAGQPLALRRIDPLLRNIKRAVVAKAQPIALIRILAEEVWTVAATNQYVGSSLMAVSVPRTARAEVGQFAW